MSKNTYHNTSNDIRVMDEAIDDMTENETPSMATFDTFGIRPEILKALDSVGYQHPSPIQEKTIPLLLDGQDVVGLAQTGTGKTAAFALPVLSQIDIQLKKPQALVLAPTRELAIQVAEAFTSYAQFLPNVNVLPIYGGQNYSVQLTGLRKGAQIVVGTPGRVIDHLERGTLDLSYLEFLVLDEADEMLTMGFQEDVERILRDTPEYKQVALFSATMPPAISKLSKKYLDNPVEIAVKSKTSTSATITQRYIFVNQGQKFQALSRFLEVGSTDGVIVFVKTKQATEELAQQLRSHGFKAAAINGDMVQAQRERTIAQLKEGSIDILIATDVAARGLDVERISLVINYDIPRDTESYVHRIGRTGRAGRTGDALLFVTPREKYLLKGIERATRQPLAEISMPTAQEVNKYRIAKFSETITQNLENPHANMLKELIQSYASESSVDMLDIAASLAASSFDADSFLLPPDKPQRSLVGAHDKDNIGSSRYDDRDKRDKKFQLYRIEVGTRDKVTPRQIVGAIAGEGGLKRSDFGHISVRADFSLVELTANLDKNVLLALKNTKICGRPIKIRVDTGRTPRGRADSYAHEKRNSYKSHKKTGVWGKK